MKKNIISLLFLVSLIGFISCEKEDNDLTVEESKTNMENLSQDIEKDMQSMTGGEGWEAMMRLNDLMSIDNPYGGQVYKKSTKPQMTLQNLLALQFNMSYIDERKSFDDYVGTYTWNATNQGWVIVQNDPADKIVINYPYEGPESQLNDLVLTIFGYEEVEITETDDFGTDTWYVPSALQADLYRNDIKLAELNMSATWDTSSGEPMSGDIVLYLKPYTLSLDFSNFNNEASIEFILENGNTRISSIGLNLTFGEDNLGEAEVEFVEGYIQYRSIKLAGSMNLVPLTDIINDPTIDEVNENVDLALYNYPQDTRFAVIEFEETINEELKINIVFEDGTVMDAETFISQIMTAMQDTGRIPVIL